MYPKNPKRILIVDDDSDFVSALEMRCHRIGLRVQTAHNALTAVATISRDLPDLVCMDVNMPTANGLNICEMMATDPEMARIPVIVLTGRKDAETIQRCHDLCVYYVHKSGDVWQRIEPVIYELVDIEPPADDELPIQPRRTQPGEAR